MSQILTVNILVTAEPILIKLETSLYVARRVSTEGYSFWGCVDTAPHLVGQIAEDPKFWRRE